ncbi:GntR family transcriptional regulator [Streptomyces sp. NPDC051567]|uniref:GntR family transcriptional regulator n=1 Tax=Streptomyces sp. NPDC051567 TaxID=3365660 RepID=UPI0037BAEED9
MSSPSRGGSAAMPKYQRIAAALRHELDRTARISPGARLPSERSLAARYQVNRQTIRAALQSLRDAGLIVTGSRGTRAATPGNLLTGPVAGTVTGTTVPPAAPRAAAGTAPAVTRPGEPDPPAAPAPGPVPTQSWLTLVTVPAPLAEALGMDDEDRTLVHHQRACGPAGETLQHAVTYLRPGIVARTPELAGYRDRPAVREEDLDPLHHWLDRAAVAGRIAETVTMTRSTHPPAARSAPGLTVRRTLHDASGQLLAVTDLAYPTWDRLTLHRDHAAGGFRVT